MSTIGSVTNYAARAASNTKESDENVMPSTNQAQGMSMSDFYKLLSTQMKYQDADNPMDTSEMMNQLVQNQMIEAINQMSSINTITYTASMVGKKVTMAEIDKDGLYTEKNTTGVVTGASLGNDPRLFIDDKPYYLSQLMAVGDVKAAETPEDKK